MSEPTTPTEFAPPMTMPTTPLPMPPRPITPAARKQSWREVAVRRWMLATLGVAAVVAAVGTRAVRGGLDARALLRDGVRVDAKIEGIFGAAGNVDRAIARPVTLSLKLPGEAEPRRVPGFTQPQAGRFQAGQTIPVVIDPKDPSRWTDRVDPVGWPSTLAAPLLLTPAVALLAGLTWLRRRRVLGVWRDGTAQAGGVLDVQTSAMVPGQKVVRVSIPGDGGASRAVSVTHPDRLGTRQRGDAVDVVVDARGNAVLAAAYA